MATAHVGELVPKAKECETFIRNTRNGKNHFSKKPFNKNINIYSFIFAVHSSDIKKNPTEKDTS